MGGYWVTMVQRHTPDFRIPKRQGFGQDRRIVTNTKRPFYGTVTPGDCAAKKLFSTTNVVSPQRSAVSARAALISNNMPIQLNVKICLRIAYPCVAWRFKPAKFNLYCRLVNIGGLANRAFQFFDIEIIRPRRLDNHLFTPRDQINRRRNFFHRASRNHHRAMLIHMHNIIS